MYSRGVEDEEPRDLWFHVPKHLSVSSHLFLTVSTEWGLINPPPIPEVSGEYGGTLTKCKGKGTVVNVYLWLHYLT